MDALRGIAMWLGVVLHGVMAYQVDPRVGWPKDANSSIGMDIIYEYLHSFRMPLFFLVAGFFARFLSKKIGLQEFLKHRVKRILLPFIFSVICIVPVTSYSFSLYRNWGTTENLFIEAFLTNLRWTGFYHIWFLYYLIMFYGIQLCLQRLAKSVSFPENWINEKVFFASTLVLVLVQYFLYEEKVEPYTGLTPQINQLFYYGYFYFCGFAINTNTNFLFKNKLARYSYFIIGFALIPLINQDGVSYMLQSFLLSIQTNLFILAHIALFMHFFKEQSNRLRYFSDGSYWFYLIHLPIVVALQLLLFSVDWSPWVKAGIVVSVTTLISMVTYELFVRYTFIGTMLNGKKTRIH